MGNRTPSIVASSYRALYGKLFSALFKQFGSHYVTEIEDALQNAFYKSLKSWKPDQIPENKEGWLFIVARNDLLNQIKKQHRYNPQAILKDSDEVREVREDLRLKTLLYICAYRTVPSKTKVVFALKNIFGLHVKEISECTLRSQEAIYKSIGRAKKDFLSTGAAPPFDTVFEDVSEKGITLVEEIIYAVFNIGFDSFTEKSESLVNEDLCLEALALGKMLLEKYGRNTTKNLLALFCFHLARIPEKVKNGKIVPFFEQDRNNWNRECMELGFYYLEKPDTPHTYYVESLITSMHMTTEEYNLEHWNTVINLYRFLCTLSPSPIIKLNLCYCLGKAQRMEEAITLLEQLETELPHEHVYFSLVKAHVLDQGSKEAEKLINQALRQIKQTIRKEHILETMAADL